MQHAHAFEPIQDGRIHGQGDARRILHGGAREFANSRGWLGLHDSGTLVRFTQSADLFEAPTIA